MGAETMSTVNNGTSGAIFCIVHNYIYKYLLIFKKKMYTNIIQSTSALAN